MTITKSELKQMIAECINESYASIDESVVNEEANDIAIVKEMNFICEATVDAAINEMENPVKGLKNIIANAKKAAAEKAAAAAEHTELQKAYEGMNWDSKVYSYDKKEAIAKLDANKKAVEDAEKKAKAAAEKAAKTEVTNGLKKYAVPAAVITATAAAAAAIGLAIAKKNAKKKAQEKKSTNESVNMYSDAVSYLSNI